MCDRYIIYVYVNAMLLSISYARLSKIYSYPTNILKEVFNYTCKHIYIYELAKLAPHEAIHDS